ncbi:hypothetical protein A6E14_16710 [Vibrio genomosp. F10]|uniref:Uncharacterized protein n=1 Tax=Vibrio genomosp. F10 TaxID=723171 RepID=A0A1B9R3F4_9VIBR|nr:hypothetical protein A6E14_16710 [Vibrio genomosp. F10]
MKDTLFFVTFPIEEYSNRVTTDFHPKASGSSIIDWAKPLYECFGTKTTKKSLSSLKALTTCGIGYSQVQYGLNPVTALACRILFTQGFITFCLKKAAQNTTTTPWDSLFLTDYF